MEAIKSFTSLEQSRKLVEILPLESADMFWRYNPNIHTYDTIPKILIVNNWDDDYNKNIPCWSLAALLAVLPNYQLQTQDNGIGVLCSCNGKFNIVTAHNPIDACYEMILKLNELKML